MSNDKPNGGRIVPGKLQEDKPEVVETPTTQVQPEPVKPTQPMRTNTLVAPEVRTVPESKTQVLSGQTRINALMDNYVAELTKAKTMPEETAEIAEGKAQRILFNIIKSIFNNVNPAIFAKEWMSVVIYIRKHKDVLNNKTLFAGLQSWQGNQKDAFLAYVRLVTLLETTASENHPDKVKATVNIQGVIESVEKVFIGKDVAMKISSVYNV